MALRITYFVLALSMLIASGCRNRSNYQPACAPAVVAVQPVAPPPCPTPPPPGVPVPGR